jgi:NAD(P)-dependent dehydrogenase (short-subunit alcohol dehydrogenase family)
MVKKFAQFDSKLPSVVGKVFVITGTTSGTGFIAAKTTAKHGGEVLLLNRPSERSTAALAKLKQAVPEGKFVPIDCDLQDFSSVRAAAKKIKDRYKTVYCLANNAGIMATLDEITKADGFDKQMQTNHLSHFLLTKELFPLILAASREYGDARIVQHSSIARSGCDDNRLVEKYFSKQEKDGMLGGNDLRGPWARYSQTKLANSVFCHVLHDKLTASENPDCKNILSVCAHPGGSKTGLADDCGWIIRLFRVLFFQSAEDGTMGLLKGMMAPRDEVEGGTLYGPVGLMELAGWAVPNKTRDYEVDPANKELLWRASETAIGGSFVV